MNYYSKIVFPFIYDHFACNKNLEFRRARIVQYARGQILEIGIGTGLNLPFFPNDITAITAIDNNPGMLKKLNTKLKNSRISIRMMCANAENLPFKNESFDTVLTTHTLCSVMARKQALSEISRVLRSDGQLVFLEHCLSPHLSIAKWQKRFSVITKKLAAGCVLDMPLRMELEKTGFHFKHLNEYHLTGFPKISGWHAEGIACCN